ncbi:hypothetical protein AB0O91_20815 [Kitasatospora sp. NPDC089797]|uniref:hypothetical protein n=1 Tax=Kitasatospora sp. NPDC089797 TaxID=3155298 RepID=UPI0034304BCB
MTTEELTHTPTEAEVRAAFVAVVGGAAVDGEEVLARAAAHPVLAAAAARAGLPGPGPLRPDLPGTAGDPRQERLDAVLTALAAHAADRLRRTGPGGASAVWGMDLLTGELRRIPLGDVPAVGRPPVGAAAGLTWLGALEEGLAQQCEALLAERLADPGVRVPRADLAPRCDGGCHPADCTACAVGALRPCGVPLGHDLSELLSVPACALRLDPFPGTVIATGTTRAEAVHRAAGRLLRRDGRTAPDVRPDQELAAGVRRLPEASRSRPFDALHAQGHAPAAILLDQDPRAVAVLPYLVHVVLPR